MMREVSLATADGAEITYRIRPGRDPWLLLHGLGCDASMWDGVVAALPPEIGLLAPELRGHGGSTLGWRLPSVEIWADDVAAVVEKAGLGRPAVAGLSMGGYTALSLAARHPGLARAYAFVSTAAGPDDEDGRMRRAQGLGTLKRQGWRVFAENLIPILLNERGAEFARHRAGLLEMFARAGDAGLAATLFALANRPDRRPILSSIGIPVAVVVGEADQLTPPPRAEEIASVIAGARLVVLPGIAHMSAMEAPREVARALLDLGP
jgi:pimeloyl-ACP methyl ester carboxylesterase